MVKSPSFEQTVQSGSAGPDTGTSSRKLVVVGTSTSGATNTVKEPTDKDSCRQLFGSGPLVEALAYAISAGVKVLGIRVAVEDTGAFGDVTKTPDAGGATLALTGSEPIDDYNVAIEVLSSGDAGEATLRISLDGGNTYSDEITADDAYSVPMALFGAGADPGITLNWTGTLAAGDVYTFSTSAPAATSAEVAAALDALEESEYDYSYVATLGVSDALGLTSVTKAGTSPPTVTASGTPADSAYDFRVEITTGGARGTAIFRWSSDGGENWTTAVTTAATTVLGSTGITLAWATGTNYSTDNVYTFGVRLPDMATMLGVLDSAATSAEAQKKPARYALSAPDVPDAVIKTTIKSLNMERVSLCAGYTDIQSAVTGRTEKHPSMIVILTRVLSGRLSENASEGVGEKPLHRVTNIYRDERKTPGLNDARVSTLRTWPGLVGQYYVNNALSLAPANSKLQLLVVCSVVDTAMRATYRGALRYSSAGVKWNLPKAQNDPNAGKIQEGEAKSIEERLNRFLARALVDGGHVTSAYVTVNRSDVIKDTQKLRWKTTINTLTYIIELEEEISVALDFEATR